MENESRTKKTLLNARINIICYFLSTIVMFLTRKVLIERLGSDFIGLTGTLTSLLGFLNIAESGIGLAISYTLYKPLFNRDRNKINEIISVLGYLYRTIGIVILLCGVVLSLFLPSIFPDTGFSWAVIYSGFYAFLASSLLGYFVNYKTVLLSADQRNYIVTGYFQLTSILKAILQMTLAIYTQSFILYFSIEILFGIVNSVILNIKIKKTYPWIDSEIKRGKILLKEYTQIKKNIKQIFVHKIGGFVQYQISPILIYSFVSISTVTLYGNYILISNKLAGLLGSILDSTNASVGNLVSEGKSSKIYSIFKELFYIRIIFSGILAFSFYFLASKFIILWLGDEFQLNNIAVILISIHLFLTVSAGTYHQFLNAFGLFHDVWAPLTESAIYIITSIIFGHLWGLIGILLGPIFSLSTIIHAWKPYFLYKEGFKIPFWKHIAMVFKSSIAITCAYLLSNEIYKTYGVEMPNSWIGLFTETILFTATLSIVTYAFSYILLPEMRSFTLKVLHKIQEILNYKNR
ncbi:MAG: sugar transporter [Bacteroidaceae bacterium]|nr:sugar transporter [Bacteroidaceae bacterium]